jgi:hypothetical protein
MNETTSKELTEEEELAILFPEPTIVPLGAKLKIAVAPMDTMTCAHFAAKARPIIRAAIESGASFSTFTSLLSALVVAMADYPEELVQSVAIAVGKSPEFIGKLPPAATLGLGRVVFEVNSDFFAQSAELLGLGVPVIQPAPQASAAHGVGPTH